jgi:hypothetical protein
MADFIQIGNLIPDELESDEQRTWLENLSDDLNNLFVEITDGDHTNARAIDTDCFTAGELLDSSYSRDFYIAVDPHATDSVHIQEFMAKRTLVKAPRYSRFDGLLYFRPVNG